MVDMDDQKLRFGRSKPSIWTVKIVKLCVRKRELQVGYVRLQKVQIVVLDRRYRQ